MAVSVPCQLVVRVVTSGGIPEVCVIGFAHRDLPLVAGIFRDSEVETGASRLTLPRSTSSTIAGVPAMHFG